MSASTEPKIRPLAPLLLISLAAAESLLSLYQWMELLVVRAGGHALCGINATLNCEAVWNSPFAERLHETLQLPVAGLGLVWGLAAFATAGALTYRLLSGGATAGPLAGVKVLAAAGVLSCITFGAASARMGALCLTCLGTYLVVLGFGLVAARGLPSPLVPSAPELKRGIGWAVGCALGAYLVLLGPGMETPTGAKPTLAQELKNTPPPPPPAPDGVLTPLERFLTSLPVEQQQEISQSLLVYRHSPSPTTVFPTRVRVGAPDAPVKIVEFTDIRCPHCRHLEETLKELRKAVPEGSFSVEPRSFPLDGECNRVIAATDGTHVRCTGAKALVCLENRPEYWDVRDKLFAEQETLTADRILELATAGGMNAAALKSCIASEETATKLNQDIAFAMEYRPQGTPLVLINGREGTASPAFLYAMTLTQGNSEASAFARLAPPPPQPVGP